MSTNTQPGGSPGRAKIVVGVDGSSQSRQALRWAARLAPTLDARIEAVAAWQFPTGAGWTALPYDWDPQSDMQKLLTATVDEVFGAHRPADLWLRLREGHPATVLLHEADGAAMVIVGSRGHGGFAGMLLGSVSAAVAEHATCPVLVVHDEDESGDQPASEEAGATS